MDPVLIDLPELKLPRDFARRVRFIDAVQRRLISMGVEGRFVPGRFVGYYFAGITPVAVSGRWAVQLLALPVLRETRELVELITGGRYTIASDSGLTSPDCILVHDTYDGSCSLWNFEAGRRFLTAREPRAPRGPAWAADESDETSGADGFRPL